MANLELLERGLSELGVFPAGAGAGAADDARSVSQATGAAARAEAEALGRLARYVEAIEEWNPAYGLVGASGDELIIKHILDSLAPVQVIDGLLASRPRDGERPCLVDLGTGAGLPGIPISIARPGLDVVLLDRMTRRIRFLEAMQARLALDNVEIVEEQVERAKGSYDIVTFRAFRPFERKLFKRVFSVCAPGGYVVAYKGKAERARAELAEIDGLFLSAEIVPVKVPYLDDERCVVVMRPAGR